MFTETKHQHRQHALFELERRFSDAHASYLNPTIPGDDATWVRPFLTSLLPAVSGLPEASAALVCRIIDRIDSADELRAVLSRLSQ